MAGSKEIKKRIVSVRNTRKITRTMEMVSTAKSKKMSNRVNASKPYGEKIADLMEGLADLKSQVESPFLRVAEKPKKAALLVVTADRGLCGGYNSNTLKLARKRIEYYKNAGVEVELYVVGKKGASFFKFMKQPVAQLFTGFDDKFQFEEAEKIADKFLELFANEKIDSLDLISTVYYSSAKQLPEITPLLPIGAADPEADVKKDGKTKKEAVLGKVDPEEVAAFVTNTTYEPSPQVILKRLLPLVVKTIIYRSLLEAITSEQIARRIAMKNATDSAGEMIKMLNRSYNRARQAAITQELSEIVAGADSV